MNIFNFPNIDHLIEGVHYTVVDWDFADGQPCPEGEKMVFGMCRKLGGKSGDKEFDSGSKTKQETEGEAEAAKQGSSAKNNKAVNVKGRKMGWAIKDGKPVLVEWGSVAGEKKVGPKKPVQQPLNRKGTRTSGLNRTSRDAYANGQDQNAANPALNPSAQQSARDNASRARGGA